jgi:hypothetical protein
MFDQQEQQGWFGTKWPLWLFVLLWLTADIPFRLFGYYAGDVLGSAWIGEVIGYVAFGVVGIAVALYYRRKRRVPGTSA